MQFGSEGTGAILAIIRMEMQRFVFGARFLPLPVFILIGIPVALSDQVPSPFIPAVAVGIVLAERWIMDMFDQRGRDFPKFAVHSLPWEWVVLGKGLAAMLIALSGAGIAALLYGWLHPSPPSPYEALRGLIAFLCLLLPVIWGGGSASLTELLRPVRTPLDMIIRAVMSLVAAAASAVPVLILLAVPGSMLYLSLYFVMLSVFWYRYGIRRTADNIRRWQTSPVYNA